MRAERQHARDRLLSWFARLSGPFLDAGRRRPEGVRRVLFVRPDHLGDFLFCTPALERWRRHAPGDVETILSVGPWCADLAAHGPAVGEIAAFPYPGFTRRPKGRPWSPYGALLGEARALRRRQIDLAVLLRFDHWWGGLLAYLAGIPLRLGYASDPLQRFLNQALPYRGAMHEVERNLALADAALALSGSATPAAPAEFPALVYHIRDASREAAGRILQRLGSAAGKPLIALQPGAGAAVKQWPAERFAALADALAQEYGATVLITGGPADLALAWRVAALAGADVAVLAGQTDLDTLAALFERCALVIGADSGPLHLAVAVGAATIHLHGPVDATLFGPWSNQPARHRVLMADCPCAPCNRLDYTPAELPEHACMERISVQEVLETARAMLGRAT